jgi:hypothetical protein
MIDTQGPHEKQWRPFWDQFGDFDFTTAHSAAAHGDDLTPILPTSHGAVPGDCGGVRAAARVAFKTHELGEPARVQVDAYRLVGALFGLRSVPGVPQTCQTI